VKSILPAVVSVGLISSIVIAGCTDIVGLGAGVAVVGAGIGVEVGVSVGRRVAVGGTAVVGMADLAGVW